MKGYREPSDFHDWAFESLSSDEDECDNELNDEPDDEPFEPDYLDYDFLSNYGGRPI